MDVRFQTEMDKDIYSQVSLFLYKNKSISE